MPLCEPRPPPTPLENRQAANKTTAIIVPALLIGVVGYATWVVVVLIGGKCCLQVYIGLMLEDCGLWTRHLRVQSVFRKFEPAFLKQTNIENS